MRDEMAQRRPAFAQQRGVARVVSVGDDGDRCKQRLEPRQPPGVVLNRAVDPLKFCTRGRWEEAAHQSEVDGRITQMKIAPIDHTAGPRLFVHQQITMVPTTWNRDDLLAVTALVDTGTLHPVIDRNYPLAAAAASLQHVEAGHARGKVVITVT